MNKNLITGLRIFFGIFMLIFGLNKFLGFMPFPPIPGDGGTLMDIYMSSGFMSLIGVIEILVGAAMVLNKFVPLALTFGIAVLFNAMVFHLLHMPSTIAGAVFGLVLGLFLVYAYKSKFKDLLSM